MSAALLKYLRRLPEDERQRVYLDRYNEAMNTAERFAVSREDVREACRGIEKESTGARRWPFVWLAGINRAHGAGRISVKGLKVGISLFGFSSTTNGYVWPGQQLIAERSGWSLQNRRGVFEGLRELEEIGAIRRLRFVDLPKEVIETAQKTGQRKPKDPRSAAYFLHPVEEWKMGDQYPQGKHSSVSPGEALNSQSKRSPTSSDSSTYLGDSPSTFLQAETSQYGTDGGGRFHG